MAERLRDASLALYHRGLANGTEPADPFDRVVVLADAQPPGFLALTAWRLQLATH